MSNMTTPESHEELTARIRKAYDEWSDLRKPFLASDLINASEFNVPMSVHVGAMMQYSRVTEVFVIEKFKAFYIKPVRMLMRVFLKLIFKKQEIFNLYVVHVMAQRIANLEEKIKLLEGRLGPPGKPGEY